MFDNRQVRGRITLKRLLLIPTGTYGPQFVRPFCINETPEMTKRLSEDLTRRVGAAAESLLGSGINDFLVYAAKPEYMAKIPGGWEQPRFAFILDFEQAHPLSPRAMTYTVMGYTDRDVGIGADGQLAPDVKFYIDRIFGYYEAQLPGADNPQTAKRQFEASYLLYREDLDLDAPDLKMRIRPTDIFAAIQRSHLPSLDKNILDTRIIAGSVPVKSAAGNNIPARYAANTFASFKEALQNDQFGEEELLFSEARNNSQDHFASRDPFLNMILEVRGAAHATHFTWRELNLVDPAIDSRTEVILPEKHTHDGSHTSLDGDALETRVAWHLYQLVTSTMMMTGTHVLKLYMENQDLIKLNAEAWNTAKGLHGEVALETVFMQYFAPELAALAKHYDVEFDGLEIEASLTGEVWIYLCLKGADRGPAHTLTEATYVIPAFAGSLLTPLVTNPQFAAKMADDFQEVMLETQQLMEERRDPHLIPRA